MRFWGFVLSLIGFVPVVHATEPLDGRLTALMDCPAYHSKNKQTNPGQVRLVPGEEYMLLGTNAPARDWVQVAIPDAPVETARWVPVDCGTLTLSDAGVVEPDTQQAEDLLLALSWQPSVCEKLTRTSECRALNAGRLPQASKRLSLHGLWPQPREAIYCNVQPEIIARDKAGRWRDLPAPDLDAETQATLKSSMPGVASGLDRHEWIKHGTCFLDNGAADEYFDDSLALLSAINASAIGNLLAARAGSEISARDIRAAADRAFGSGAGARLQVICSDDGQRRLVREIRIALRGEITDTPDMGALMRAAPRQSLGCRRGVLDPAGLQ